MLRSKALRVALSTPSTVAPKRWLLLALQLPATPSNARVKTWRRLQHVGAIALKGSLYALPYSTDALEDFEWLRQEIEALDGQASVFEASSLHGLEDARIVDQFRKARARDYKHLLRAIKAAQAKAKRAARRSDESAKTLRQLQAWLTGLKRIDFFSAPGRELAEAELSALERLVQPPRQPAAVDSDSANCIDPSVYQNRMWLTRSRPGVDRMASAWLISTFIDGKAQFAFADDPSDVPDAVPFDMYNLGFSHEGIMCTFEVLQAKFRIDDPAVRRISEVVHDLDLKEDRFRAIQSAGVATLIDGLQRQFEDDSELLAQGILMFNALYRGLQSPPLRSARIRRMRSRQSGGSQ
jgi:hypothetical protein